jgi:hypothetical protein
MKMVSLIDAENKAQDVALEQKFEAMRVAVANQLKISSMLVADVRALRNEVEQLRHQLDELKSNLTGDGR